MSDVAADDSLNREEVDLQMSDKASFREKSSSFQKLLEESSKYRKKETLPDPSTQKPGKRLENLSPRSVSDPDGNNSEEATTPRLNRRPQDGGGPLKKTNSVTVEIEQASPAENKSRYSQFTELPPGPNVPPSTPRGMRQPVQRQVSLPPVAGPDRRKMNDVLMFSRQGSDIHTRLKRSSSNEAGYGSAPNSPSLSRGPLSARRGKIDLDLK